MSDPGYFAGWIVCHKESSFIVTNRGQIVKVPALVEFAEKTFALGGPNL